VREWWRWIGALGLVVIGVALLFHEMQPQVLVLDRSDGMAVVPVAVDTGGYCRVVYWAQKIERVP
jgi:hypothetical protein